MDSTEHHSTKHMSEDADVIETSTKCSSYGSDIIVKENAETENSLPATISSSDPPSPKQPIRITQGIYDSPDYDDETCSFRGLAVIVQNFKSSDSSIDCLKKKINELAEILQNIENQGFELFNDMIYENLTKSQLEKLCTNVAKEDFRDHYCLLFVILARGKPGLIECHESSGYLEQSEILKYFQPQNCPLLALKPKMFIIQTLKGGPDPNQADTAHSEDEVQQVRTVKIPRESDFLTYTSCEYFPLKDNVFLSLLIDVLSEEKANWDKQCYKFNKDVPEIQRILIRINRKFKTKCPGKQLPCTMSSLTKRMYLQRRTL